MRFMTLGRLTRQEASESAALVVPGEEEVVEGNEGTLEFWPMAVVDDVGREGLPDNGLASVGIKLIQT